MAFLGLRHGLRPARGGIVVRELSFAQAAHPALPPLAVSLVVAVLTALVLPLRRVWPGPVFAVMVLMAAALAVAVEAPAAGQAGGITAGWPRSTKSSRSHLSWWSACT